MGHMVHRVLKARKPSSVGWPRPQQTSHQPIEKSAPTACFLRLPEAIPKALKLRILEWVTLHPGLQNVERIACDPIDVAGDRTWKGDCPGWDVLSPLAWRCEITAGVLVAGKVNTSWRTFPPKCRHTPFEKPSDPVLFQNLFKAIDRARVKILTPDSSLKLDKKLMKIKKKRRTCILIRICSVGIKMRAWVPPPMQPLMYK